MELSHKEFIILCEENLEMTHDRREEEAMFALMYSVASRGKGKKGKLPKVHELYDRDSMKEPEKVEDVLEQQQQAIDWIRNFTIAEKGDDEDESEEVKEE